MQTKTNTTAERLREIDLTQHARLFEFIKWANYILVVFSMGNLMTLVVHKVMVVAAAQASFADFVTIIPISIYAFSFYVGWTNIGTMNPVLRPQTLVALCILMAYEVSATLIVLPVISVAMDVPDNVAEYTLFVSHLKILGELLGVLAILRARLVRVKELDMRLAHILRKLESYARANPTPRVAPPKNRVIGFLFVGLGLTWIGGFQLFDAEFILGLHPALQLIYVLISFGGYFFILYARSYFQPKIENLLAIDNRSPIVFLRSFTDDEKIQYNIDNLSLIDFSVEEHLAGHFSRLGPFIAVGAPEDKLPRLGAVRAKLSDDVWQGTILEWMDRAQIIVLIAGVTHWLQWELEMTVGRGHAEKLVLAFPQSRLFPYWRRRRNLDMRLKAMRKVFAGSPWEPALTSLSIPAHRLRSLVFEPAGGVVVITGKRRNRPSYFLAVLLAHYLILNGREHLAAAESSIGA